MRAGAPSPLLLALLSPLPLGLACNDQSLGRFNSPPEASITSHLDGDEVQEGYEITVRGAASDPNHAAEELRATWYLGDQVACPEAAPGEDGLTTCTLTPAPGQDKLTLEVRDPDDAADSASVTLTLLPTAPPTAEILLPTDSERYYSDRLVSFQATVADAEDAPEDLVLAWQSSLDGALALAGAPDSSGLVTTSGTLSAGQHAITLTVTDRSGKSGADQVVITVGPPNSAPTCAMTGPVEGGAAASGSSVGLSGTVGDADQPADSLVVQFSSSLDGAVGTPQTPTSDGSVSLAWPGLSTGVHTLGMTVTDELGATCTDARSWTVGSVPQVRIDLPAEGEVVNLGASTTFQGTVSDGEEAPTALDLQWSSSLDGALSSAGADSSGRTTFSTAALSAGTHLVTLSATDGTDLSASATRTLVVNQPPTAPTVSISPTSPRTDDDVGVIIEAASTDPEGDPVRYGYAWYRDGVEMTAWTDTAVDASATSRGQTWRVVVTPHDGHTSGPSGSAEVEIGNTPPVMISASLTPTSLFTGDTATANASASDADGDAVSLSYAWRVDGSAVSATGSSLSGATWFDKGQTVMVTVTPDDGTDSGTPLSSSTLTVQNSPPTAPVVEIDPEAPLEGEDELFCAVATPATDADGDALAYFVEWEVDGVAFADATSHVLHGDTVRGEDTLAGEEWTCTVTPDDGEVSGPSASDTVTILTDDIDYSGTWDMGRTLSEDCALGMVSMSFRYWVVDEDAPDISLTSSGSGIPGVLDGVFTGETTFEVSRSEYGSCTETYTVEGTFVDETTLEGTLTAEFSGGLWCFDCVTTSWDFTATR
ncbi:Ig-like domain-containing protein [Myxococcota bacterium]|nr:Ig-like domain-containing protein [Myxococcota bacterium]